MKKTILLLLAFLAIFPVFGQNTTSKDAKQIKGMKLIVALEEYRKKSTDEEKQTIDSINMLLKKYMGEMWKFNEIVDYMPLSEAEEFVKKNKKTHCYIHLGEEVTTRNSTYTCYGNILSINAPKRLVYDVLPYFDGDMDQVAIVFGIQQLQYILNLLDQEKIHAITDLRKYIRKNNGSKVINKTLLIPKEYLSPKISVDDIKAIYPYDMEICSNEKIERVILSKDPKYAVVFYIPTFAGSGKVEFLYISGAEDGEIFGFDVKGNVRLNGIALNPKGKYIINKNELKKIGDMVD